MNQRHEMQASPNVVYVRSEDIGSGDSMFNKIIIVLLTFQLGVLGWFGKDLYAKTEAAQKAIIEINTILVYNINPRLDKLEGIK